MAHELNNALNGASMNLEVVRLRAVAGKDAGAVAPFAAAALAEQEAVAGMTAALLALGRPPAPGRAADVRAVLGHVVALVAPVVRHHGVTLAVEAPNSAPTAAPALAVRLAAAWAVERAAGLAAPQNTVAFGNPAGDRSGRLRCILSAAGEPTLVVDPPPVDGRAGGAGVADDAVPALLAAHGIRAAPEGVGFRLTFPAA